MGCELTYDVGAMAGAMAKSRLPSGTGHCYTSGYRSLFYFRSQINVLFPGTYHCFTFGCRSMFYFRIHRKKCPFPESDKIAMNTEKGSFPDTDTCAV